MTGRTGHLREVGVIVRHLTDLSLEPVLVGGMALVMLGSRRVTRDFDFIIAHPRKRLVEAIDVMYDRGLELVSRLSEHGDVVATIDNRRIAAVRLRLDAPASAYFFNRQTGLRIDLLFDFPIDAATLASRGQRTKVRSHVLCVACEEDLLRLKKIARARRSSPGDTEDIAFLEARQNRSR